MRAAPLTVALALIIACPLACMLSAGAQQTMTFKEIGGAIHEVALMAPAPAGPPVREGDQ